jgi:V8-like Glu-specific endopeptidase
MASSSEHDHEHGNGTDAWDFPPIYPYPVEDPPMEELPDEGLPEDPTDHEGFMDWVESRCGPTNDKQPVEQYDGTLGVSRAFVDTHESPVGVMQWNDNLDQKYSDPGAYSGARWCTGTLVTDDLFLTAGHCFDSAPGVPRKNGQRLRPHEIATNMHVDFNYQVDPSGNLRQEQRFDIVDLVEHRRGGLDYAVARLSGTPGNQFGTATLATSPVQQGDTLCIIQHPKGRPKKIEAGTATHIHSSSTTGHLGQDYFGYGDIDTLGGSSGSGVLRESDGAIVGVHTNGGCRGTRGGHNHGVKIGPILDESDAITALPIKNPFEGKTPIAEKTPEKLKFTDEGPGGGKLLMDPPLGSGGRGTVKHVDDRKATGLDKPPADPTVPGGTGTGVPGGGGVGGAGGAGGLQRPFVLQTPHHVGQGNVGGQHQAQAQNQSQGQGYGQGYGAGGASGDGQAAGLQATYEQLLTEMQQFLQQQQTQLQSIDEQYRQLAAEYQQLLSQGQGQWQGQGPQR